VGRRAYEWTYGYYIYVYNNLTATTNVMNESVSICYSCSPMKVMLPSDCVVHTLRCGGDGTAVITADGTMMTCGRNSFNKLGLAERNRGLFSFNFEVSSIIFP
jgi:alpha-tubulin suppressor-like RCC1 family protein